MILTTDYSSIVETRKYKRGAQSLKEKLTNFQAYIERGNERGRSASAATVYQSNAGYFFVTRLQIDGQQHDLVMFSHEKRDIVRTNVDALKALNGSSVLALRGAAGKRSFPGLERRGPAARCHCCSKV